MGKATQTEEVGISGEGVREVRGKRRRRERQSGMRREGGTGSQPLLEMDPNLVSAMHFVPG